MQNIYEKLEFFKIKNKVKTYSKTELGNKYLDAINMYQDINELKYEKQLLKETIDVVSLHRSISVDNVSDIKDILIYCSKGGILDVEEIYTVSRLIEVENQVISYFEEINDIKLDKLQEIINELPDLVKLQKRINKVITPDLKIYDNASPKLKSIRNTKRKLDSDRRRRIGTLVSEFSEYLSSQNLTIRNDTYVLPVINSYKYKIKGIIQGVSKTGETVFIEPAALVNINNEITEVENQERQEINRILLELTKEIRESKDELFSLNYSIGKLDFLNAKALYSIEIDGTIPELSDKPVIDIKQARHPLIDPKKVIANDFYLDEKTYILVISGPNAGGKTVALKTLGLMILMNQSALPLPVLTDSKLSYFDNLFLDIGDSQSLSDDLSTFSGHMKNISEVLPNVNERTLVLFDELGTGTAPKEGEAIAISILEYLRKNNAFTLISSHYEGLKAYALVTKGVTNASMLFTEDLYPTYKMKIGVPGESYGLLLAKRLGLPESVLNEANQILSSGEDASLATALSKLKVLSDKLENERNEVLLEKNSLTAREDKIRRKEQKLARQANKSKEAVREKENKLVDEYTKKLDKIFKNVAEGSVENIKMHEIIQAKKDIENMQHTNKEHTFNHNVKVGDYVKIPSIDIDGEIIEKRGKKVTVKSSDGMTWTVAKNKVCLSEKPKATKVKKDLKKSSRNPDSLISGGSVPLEINLIGMRYEEAYRALDEYIDKCLLKGHKNVKIIHGFGSGILRKMTHDYCKKHPSYIKSYKIGGEYDGGSGVTLIEFK